MKNVIYNFIPKVSVGCMCVSASHDFSLKMVCNCAFPKNTDVFIPARGLSRRDSESHVMLALGVDSASVLQGKVLTS